MDILTIIGILILIGIALLLILYPLWQQTRFQTGWQTDRNQTGQTHEEYEARYQAQLAAIKDLMFDHEMGKVSSEDYEILLTRAKLEAAKIRQQVDHLRSGPESAPINATLDAEIEALITRVRANSSTDNKALYQEVTAEIELLKNTQSQSAVPTRIICRTCHNSLQPDDAFCSRCGQPAPPPEAEAKAVIDPCPQCGYTVQPDDAFCTKCGAALAKDGNRQSYEDARI